ncbi:hypothetical protein O3Q52_19935 [Streptomyces sp. ActVer]|uniref:hypothetical protein n=1 Tax=Streptomyces sp. ActVer TaxID=3014558 RepID=UPI0022B316B1|nr:hypothetical protein [Streptomyces sp. ActVer]MCZ4510417.1 hypothetical protein [Streptomyces sp. ActVer]
MPGRKHTGYRSRAQWRYFFANPRLRRYARAKSHATKGGPIVRYRRLPARRGARRR